MRLTDERTSELFAGVLELVIGLGYDNVTVDAIAARTHTSKATLYRRWGSKSRLVVDALMEFAEREGKIAPPDFGSISEDLHNLVDRLPVEDEFTGLIVSVTDASRRDDDLCEAFHGVFVGRFQEILRIVLQRAIDRGEVDSKAPALPFLQEALLAPRLYASLLATEEPSNEYIHRYIDSVVIPVLSITSHNLSKEN